MWCVRRSTTRLRLRRRPRRRSEGIPRWFITPARVHPQRVPPSRRRGRAPRRRGRRGRLVDTPRDHDRRVRRGVAGRPGVHHAVRSPPRHVAHQGPRDGRHRSPGRGRGGEPTARRDVDVWRDRRPLAVDGRQKPPPRNGVLGLIVITANSFIDGVERRPLPGSHRRHGSSRRYGLAVITMTPPGRGRSRGANSWIPSGFGRVTPRDTAASRSGPGARRRRPRRRPGRRRTGPGGVRPRRRRRRAPRRRRRGRRLAAVRRFPG